MTPINAPYRVRVIEMVIEVTFEETVNILLAQCSIFSSQYVSLIVVEPQCFD